jgi:hypothetical protein
MKREKHWKQANPRDQVISMLMSAEGRLECIRIGCHGNVPSNVKNAIRCAQYKLQDAQKVLPSLPAGEWDRE